MLLSQLSMSAMLPLLLILFFFTGLKLCEAQYQGDACSVDGSSGVCISLRRCPPVYLNITKGHLPRAVCGYLDFDPIVCCPKKKQTKVTSTTLATPTDSSWGTKARAECEEFVLKIPKFIVGGTKAVVMEFTFMAAVGFNSNERGIAWLCGGSLISERFVVTAAHCTYNNNWGSATWVRLGDLNLERTDDDENAITLRVVDRIRHPWYRRPSEYHDIALLKLERDVKFNPWIKPCCLANSLPDIGTVGKAIALGWGRVDWAGDTSSDLLKVTLDLVPQSKCNNTFTNGTKDDRLEHGIVGDWQLCAGGLGKDTCQGDSGGPLAILNETNFMYNLIGVTSLGKLCGSITPGIYTRIYNYVSWIEDIVWPDS